MNIKEAGCFKATLPRMPLASFFAISEQVKGKQIYLSHAKFLSWRLANSTVIERTVTHQKQKIPFLFLYLKHYVFWCLTSLVCAFAD